MKRLKSKLALLVIVIIGFLLRIYGINWDQDFHLHPDERMLIMVADRIKFFSNLNPDFFNYGSLPIYILKITASLTNLATYDGMLSVGRLLSVFVDLFTIIFIYKTALLLFRNKSIALFSSFFYSISFFPIQNAHFFVVDVFLTLFSTLLIYQLLRYIQYDEGFARKTPTSSIKRLTCISITFAAALATKFTAIIFLPIILLIIFINVVRAQRAAPLQDKIFPFILHITYFLLLISFFFMIFMPYAFIEHKRFIADIASQIKMNSDPYIFPYTLQYIGTTPYLYYLKNIFLWGIGPFISLLSIAGIFHFYKNILSLRAERSGAKQSQFLWGLLRRFALPFRGTIARNDTVIQYFFLIFYVFYFLVIGRSSVKFMRYMLPLYPFFAILAGYGLNKIQNSKFRIQNFPLLLTTCYLLLLLSIASTLLFMTIYSRPHTRITATEWIIKNIPQGSTIAVEHWDDRLPLYESEKYSFEELQLYNIPDDTNKWSIINNQLDRTDYLIIASNRLYTPLQKLSDCSKYKLCYPKTAEYYKNLLQNNLVIAKQSQTIRFKKIAEFTSYPNLCFMFHVSCYMLNDDAADESFTVYDHPKIMIYKKNAQ